MSSSPSPALPLHYLPPSLMSTAESEEEEYEFFYVPAARAAGEEAPAPKVLLRTTLKKYLKQLKLSAEAAVTLEYAPTLQAPKQGPQEPAKDWIGAVEGSEG